MAWKPGAKYRRTLRLFQKQNGVCWICGFPMQEPNQERRKSPGRWEANLDHLGQKCGLKREIKAAHAGCNSARGHKTPDEMQDWLSFVKGKFMNAGWVKGTFGVSLEEVMTRGLLAAMKSDRLVYHSPASIERFQRKGGGPFGESAYHPDMQIEKL
jgi:hypothetical protein